jgi:predicted SAM-dependent methyltransferase
MRLNLGCGTHYKKDFINIDAFDATVADVLMSVEDLGFPANSVDAIEACQLIEHLGYFHTISALEEWFRVLKPGGTLLIETPDLESSMQQYLHGSHETKKEVLTWIYGVESPGMEHRLCIPRALMKDLLIKSGFTRITTSYFTKEIYHPVMRVTGKKTKDSQAFHIIGSVRKDLVKQHLIQFDDMYLTLEQQNLLDFFLLKLQKYLENNDVKILERLVRDGCMKSVPMTRLFFQECCRQTIVPKDIGNHYNETISFLSSLDFTDLIYALLQDIPPVAGSQKRTMTVVTLFGKQSIQTLLSRGKNFEAVKKRLVVLSKNYPHHGHVFFSETQLEHHAANLCYRAIKDFTLKDYAKASAKLQEAIRLDRNHLLYYWNLGRLSMLTNNIPEAARWYQDAATLAHLAPAQQKTKLLALIQKEHAHFSPTKHGTPVIDVRL